MNELVIASIWLFFLSLDRLLSQFLQRMPPVSDTSMSLTRIGHCCIFIGSFSVWNTTVFFPRHFLYSVTKSVDKFVVSILVSYLLNNERKCEHGISKHCRRILFSSCKQSTEMWIWDGTMRHRVLQKSDYRLNLREKDLRFQWYYHHCYILLWM